MSTFNRKRQIDKAIAELESQELAADDFFKTIADRNPKPFSPPQRTWIGLTDDEVNNAIKEKNITPLFTYRMIARAIEAKLKQKNGYAEEKNT